eukprot:12417936-Alexandrium_andersonii.AAC.1
MNLVRHDHRPELVQMVATHTRTARTQVAAASSSSGLVLPAGPLPLGPLNAGVVLGHLPVPAGPPASVGPE